ncbi:Hypothetical predicted protein [Lecanosticta acicola]|uniref:Mitochondrial transcription factor 1 n=1 Tax=Lecanosticta acicola TaxID=111012 RepID=A0AAI8Z1J9_9PEZI|nr:Hypothetical predicted protein [Lecanosticta acicola]
MSVARRVSSLIDPKDPIVSKLGRVFGGYLPGQRSPVKGLHEDERTFNRKGDAPRTDIVSGKLCDDVLKYLAPTLEPYRGCTVIDVHPGACLWSQKLHDFLKPKRHLLMEPEEAYLDTFVKPLLEKPGSTYRHTKLSGAHPREYWSHYQTAIDEGLLPPMPKVSPDDSASRQLDTSVLLTGNLARLYQERSKARTADFPNVILQQMSWAALSNDICHRQGRVRMLWWLPDRHKEALIPQRHSRVNPLSAGLFLGTDITEVTGVQPANTFVTGPDARESSVDALYRHTSMREKAADDVQRRMREKGMSIPRGRKPLYPDISSKGKPREYKDLVSPVAIRYETVKEFEGAFKECEARVKEVTQAAEKSLSLRTPKSAQKVLKPLHDSLRYPQCIPLTTSLHNFRPGRGVYDTVLPKGEFTVAQSRVMIIMDCSLRIVNMEAHYKHLEDKGLFSPEQLQSFKTNLISMEQTFRAEIDDKYRVMARYVDQLVTHQLVFFASPPIIPFDRRSYESLLADTSDFWPKLPLALLDLTPTTRDLRMPPEMQIPLREVIKTTHELLKYLYLRRGSSLPSVLEMIAPNASKDLLPDCKTIEDPRRGGRLNVEALKVRMLSTDMIEELVRAWFEWPFKPNSWELALATGGSAQSLGGGGSVVASTEEDDEEEEDLDGETEDG